MATIDSNKLKVKEPDTVEDIELPILPQWEGIINRPTSLSDLDQTAQDDIDSATATFLTLGDLAYLNSITTTEITDNAITTPKLFAGAVTSAKISVGTLDAISADFGDMTAGTITGVTITGGTIRTSISGARVQMLDSTNTLQILDSGGTVRAESFADGIEFSRSTGTTSGKIYDDSTLGSFVMLGIGRNVGIITDGNQVELGTANLGFQLNETTNSIRSNGDLEPWLDASDNLGTNSTRWATIYGDAIDANNSMKLNGVTINNWTDISSGANTALSNLTTTSINKSLLPAGSTQDIGSTTLPWDWVYTDDLDIRGGNIYYNGSIALDLASSTIWVGDSITSFRPGVNSNLGSTIDFWQTLYVNDIWMNNDIDMNYGRITDIDELQWRTGGANTVASNGGMTFYDSGTVQYRGQILGVEYSFDLTSA